MPFSDIEFKDYRLEMNDVRLMDFIEFTEEAFQGFVKLENSGPDLKWLNLAIQEWKEEMDMPPGCKVIRLDKWVTERNRMQVLMRLVNHISIQVNGRTPPIPKLAGEIERVKKFLKKCSRLIKD